MKLEKQVEELKEELEKQVRKFQAPAWSSLFHKEEIKGDSASSSSPRPVGQVSDSLWKALAHLALESSISPVD